MEKGGGKGALCRRVVAGQRANIEAEENTRDAQFAGRDQIVLARMVSGRSDRHANTFENLALGALQAWQNGKVARTGAKTPGRRQENASRERDHK